MNKRKEEIERIDICTHDKAEQIYDMSKQYEKLLNENTLLKEKIDEMEKAKDENDRYRTKQGLSV